MKAIINYIMRCLLAEKEYLGMRPPKTTFQKFLKFGKVKKINLLLLSPSPYHETKMNMA